MHEPDNDEDRCARFHARYVAAGHDIAARLSMRFPGASRDDLEAFVHATIDRLACLAVLERVPGFPRDVLAIDPASTRNHHEAVLVPAFFWLRQPHEFGTGLRVNGREQDSTLARLPFLATDLFPDTAFEQRHVIPWIAHDAGAGTLDVRLPAPVLSNDDVARLLDLVGKPIDLDVLGYVFEQGLDQNAHGAFYTPKHVTARMARSSLTCWLWQWIPDDVKGKVARVEKPPAGRLPGDHEPGTDIHAACAERLEHVIYHPDGTTGDILDAVRLALRAKLDAVTILDPSCGAGAFLVAMLAELLSLHERLAPAPPTPDEFYDRAAAIVEHNLFGIDILPGATAKAALRLRLAVAARCPRVKAMRPLPGLVHKLLAGNAVIGYARPRGGHDDGGHGDGGNPGDHGSPASIEARARGSAMEAATSQLVIATAPGAYEAIKLAFLDASRGNTDPAIIAIEAKVRARPDKQLQAILSPAEVNAVFTRLGIPFTFTGARATDAGTDPAAGHGSGAAATRPDPVVRRCLEWMAPFHWADGFTSGLLPRGGFDILAGNPPYEGARKESTRDAALPAWNRLQRVFLAGLQAQQEYRMITGAWDLCLPFVERAFGLVNEAGIISLILPRSFGTTDYSSRVMDHVATNQLMIQVTRFDPRISLFHRFDDASGRPATVGIQNIIITMRNRPGGDPRHAVVEYTSADLDDRARLKPEVRQDYALRCHPFATTRFEGIPLKFLCCIVKGLQATANADDPAVRGTFTQADLVSASPDALHPMPLFSTQHVVPFKIIGSSWLEWGTARVPGQLHRKRHDAFFEGEFMVTPRSAQQTPFALINGNDRAARLDDKLILFKRWSEWHFETRASLLAEGSIRRTMLDLIENGPARDMQQVARHLAVLSQYVTCKALIGILASEVFQQSLSPLRRSFGKFEVGQWREIKIPFFYPHEIEAIDAHVDAIMQATARVHEDMRAGGVLDADVVKFIRQAWAIPLAPGSTRGEEQDRKRPGIYKLQRRPGAPVPGDRAFHELVWLGSGTMPSLEGRIAVINDMVIESMARPEAALFWNVARRLPACARDGFEAFFSIKNGDPGTIDTALTRYAAAMPARHASRAMLLPRDEGSLQDLAACIDAIKERKMIKDVPALLADFIDWLGRRCP